MRFQEKNEISNHACLCSVNNMVSFEAKYCIIEGPLEYLEWLTILIMTFSNLLLANWNICKEMKKFSKDWIVDTVTYSTL